MVSVVATYLWDCMGVLGHLKVQMAVKPAPEYCYYIKGMTVLSFSDNNHIRRRLGLPWANVKTRTT